MCGFSLAADTRTFSFASYTTRKVLGYARARACRWAAVRRAITLVDSAPASTRGRGRIQVATVITWLTVQRSAAARGLRDFPSRVHLKPERQRQPRFRF